MIYFPASPSPLGGRIIFVSATLHYTGTPLQAHVGVAKAGVDALSNSVAIEFGPRGITSNIIAPGPIAGTEGMERLSRKEDAAAGKKQIPLGRWGTVREIADATVYLFSEAASYVNGTTLVGESELCSSLPVEVPCPEGLVPLLWLLRPLRAGELGTFLICRAPLNPPFRTDMRVSLTKPHLLAVDGGSWRTQSTNPSSGFLYPDFLLGDDIVSGVKGTKKAKL